MGYDIERFCVEICKLIGCEIKWKVAESFQKERAKREIIERKNICEIKNSKKYKFIEYTLWDEKKDFCVIMGFNPAEENPNIIDKTNGKLIKNKFFDNLGGVVLLNLYPQVSKTKVEFEDNDEIDKKYQEKLVEILEHIAQARKKIVVFWGRTVSVDKVIKDKLAEFPSGDLYKTVKKDDNKGSHYHPARVEIDIKTLTINDFAGGYYLQ